MFATLGKLMSNRVSRALQRLRWLSDPALALVGEDRRVSAERFLQRPPSFEPSVERQEACATQVQLVAVVLGVEQPSGQVAQRAPLCRGGSAVGQFLPTTDAMRWVFAVRHEAPRRRVEADRATRDGIVDGFKSTLGPPRASCATCASVANGLSLCAAAGHHRRRG